MLRLAHILRASFGQHRAVAIEVARGRPQRAFTLVLESEEVGAADRANQRAGDRDEREVFMI
jgi:hypothetical protein